MLRPSAEDPFAAAAQQLDRRHHPVVLAHLVFLFVDDGFAGWAGPSLALRAGFVVGLVPGVGVPLEERPGPGRGPAHGASAEGMMVLPGVGAVRSGGSP